MYHKYHWLYFFIPSIFLGSHAQDQKIYVPNFCYNEKYKDSRLITNRFMTINVSQRIDCVIECDKEPCCRSINIQKKSSSHDAQICEMLHNVVYNTSEELLETNPSFDHVYLTSSKKDYNASCLFPKACKYPKALGMQSGKIPDSRITASSEWPDGKWGPRYARLHGNKCWVTQKSDTNQWLQIDFKYKATVTEILTQGRGGKNNFVRNYTIAYSDDGIKFKAYKGDEGNNKKFLGNTDGNSVVRQEVSPVLVARFIRIQPETWESEISLRTEIHGCVEDIDECSRRIYSCHENARCVDTIDSYDCECHNGYHGDGIYCTGPFSESMILANETVELNDKLAEWLPGTGKWSICWRGTEHGWAASTFHDKCNEKKTSLVIVKVVTGGKSLIFGGYCTETWAGTGYTSAPGSFIFSLRNNEDLLPFKAPLKDENNGYAIHRDYGQGPRFGGGPDFYIADHAVLNRVSYTKFGHTYQSPSGPTSTKSLLAGSYYFIPTEIEVLY